MLSDKIIIILLILIIIYLTISNEYFNQSRKINNIINPAIINPAFIGY